MVPSIKLSSKQLSNKQTESGNVFVENVRESWKGNRQKGMSDLFRRISETLANFFHENGLQNQFWKIY